MATAKKVLVTGIGGNVGQGIIRNIRAAFPDLHIAGCNISAFSAGNHLCDSFHEVPYSYDKEYIPTIVKIVRQEGIDLIIPSTDHEVFYLSANAGVISAKIAASGTTAAEIYLDKLFSYDHHQKFNIPFADTCLPSLYKGEFGDIIAKPRKGRGSRGLHVNPLVWKDFNDEEYIIQRLYKGEEITTAFYVNRGGALHGHITMQRSLDNGATTQCKVIRQYDPVVEPILEAMIRHSDIKGSANLQSIVSPDGSIHPFEVNCRISGTNSIRSHFGFEDVKYTILEYLFNEAAPKPSIQKGLAVRILMDVIYPDKEDFNECRDNTTDFLLF